jgi:hypothetical protein
MSQVADEGKTTEAAEQEAAAIKLQAAARGKNARKQTKEQLESAKSQRSSNNEPVSASGSKLQIPVSSKL